MSQAAKRPLLLLLSAFLVAALLLFAAVLPAEYGRDPSGLGQLLGTDRLWAEPEQVAGPPAGTAAASASRSFPQPWQSHVVEIHLPPTGDPERRDEVEYKVHMEKGATAIYGWTAEGVPAPDEFYTEFHGHTLDEGKAMTVAYYRKALGTRDDGAITAPFDGVHGWFFQNQSDHPVTIRLRIAGFYDLVPPGQPGNEAGFRATPVD